jgi:protein-S-isoprenylcysteine O-methyltransferase Ste14
MLKPISIFAYLGMVAGIIGLIVTRSLLSPSPFVIMPQAGALFLMIWARIAFGRRSFHPAANPTEGVLVTTGPYRLIRHPIYTAVCLFTGAGVLSHRSWQAALLGGLVLAGSLSRLFCEEVLVVAKCPEYRQYALKTWRMIPFLF